MAVISSHEGREGQEVCWGGGDWMTAVCQHPGLEARDCVRDTEKESLGEEAGEVQKSFIQQGAGAEAAAGN